MQIPLQQVDISDEVVEFGIASRCEVIDIPVELAHLFLDSLNPFLQDRVEIGLSLADLDFRVLRFLIPVLSLILDKNVLVGALLVNFLQMFVPMLDKPALYVLFVTVETLLFDVCSNFWVLNKDLLEEESLAKSESFDFRNRNENEFRLLVVTDVVITNKRIVLHVYAELVLCL